MTTTETPADSGTNIMVNESYDQVDIIVSISGGSAANLSGCVVLLSSN